MGLFWRLVDLVYTCESLDLTTARSSIDTLAVRLFAVLLWCSDMNQEKVSACTTRMQNGFPYDLTRPLLWCNVCCNDCCTCSGELGSKECDAFCIVMTVFCGEAQS
jgi:hypothetical protein